ncbi:hypothetical protein Pvag_pPag30248 (plasmid) [Pantoea vagans C9-1]|nr:hypothetical protein Pvag_pPag30248 [Pantoea vagans C9-1]
MQGAATDMAAAPHLPGPAVLFFCNADDFALINLTVQQSLFIRQP